MWIEKCPHCQESVIIQTEGMKFTIFLGVFTAGKISLMCQFCFMTFLCRC